MDYLQYWWTNHGITILYHLHSVGLAHYEIFWAKVGNGGIKYVVKVMVNCLVSIPSSQRSPCPDTNLRIL